MASPSTPPIPLLDALAQLLESVPLPRHTEDVPTHAALGRFLADDIVAADAVPSAANSAMDGYAIRTADLNVEGATHLPVAQRVTAGTAPGPLPPGAAARIFTGACVPDGADAVVMQEICQTDGDRIVIPAKPGPGQNVRPAGDDIGAGETVLSAGQRLRPQDLAVAASVGRATLPVFSRLTVAVVVTGDELVAPGRQLKRGQIYDSNRYTLVGLLTALGAEVIDYGPVRDNPEAIEETLRAASRSADLILTSGGVSVGEEDHVRSAASKLGRLSLWRVAIRPGKPVAFGEVQGTTFIGLPGNPVALFVTLSILARPAILRMSGGTRLHPLRFPVRAAFDTRKAIPLEQYLRAALGSDDGETTAALYGHQGSGAMSSTVGTDGLVIVPPNRQVERGDTVEFIPFTEIVG